MRYRVITTDGRVLLDKAVSDENIERELEDLDGKMKEYENFDLVNLSIDFYPGTQPKAIHDLDDIEETMVKLFSMTLGPNYKGFVEHIEEWERAGIPHSMSDMADLSKRYGTEVPEFLDGKPVFKTI